MTMKNDLLNEREFELINIIGDRLFSNQRDLSRHLDLSLGMTNMLIHRLIEKGFIRIKQLNKKKVEYLLTPKGFTEKMRKSIHYTVKTLRSISYIRQKLQIVLMGLYQRGYRDFYTLGDSDFVALVETILQESTFNHCQIIRCKDVPANIGPGILLICTEQVDAEKYQGMENINLIEELAKDKEFVSHGNRV